MPAESFNQVISHIPELGNEHNLYSEKTRKMNYNIIFLNPQGLGPFAIRKDHDISARNELKWCHENGSFDVYHRKRRDGMVLGERVVLELYSPLNWHTL